ncbi:MAG: hypothetical protein ACQERD_00410 [Campylobacterota bacterium]
MFRQVKSALFWYYLYKFRKRVILISILLLIALFSNAIYGDVVQYLKLKDKLEYLEIALFLKWGVIIFNLTYSIYLILTIFKKYEQTKNKKPKDSKKTKPPKSIDELSSREKSFIYKKKLNSKADYLVNRK